MIDAPPVAARSFDQRGVAARPPFLARIGGAHQRIGRAVFPGTVDRLRACGDHHVPGGRTRRATDGGHHVEVFAVAHDLRAFRREALDHPVVGITPRIVNMFDGAIGRQPIVLELHAIAAREEQVSLAVLADDVARVDVRRQIEVDGLAPRAAHRFRMHHVVRASAAGAGREVDEVTAIVFGDVAGPDRADGRRQCGADGAPVHEVARMPDDDARIRVERRERHPVVVAVLEDGGIGRSPENTGLRNVPSPRSAMRWPSKPLPQRRSDQSVRRLAAQASCCSFALDFASAMGVAATAPPTSSDFSASRRVLFFMPRKIARFVTGVMPARKKGLRCSPFWNVNRSASTTARSPRHRPRKHQRPTGVPSRKMATSTTVQPAGIARFPES